MKKLIVLIFIVLMATTAHAAMVASNVPNPDENVTGVQMEVNSFEKSWTSVDLSCRAKQVGCIWFYEEEQQDVLLIYNVVEPNGENTYRAKFKNNMGEEGDFSNPFVYNRSRPGKPELLIIPLVADGGTEKQ